MISQKKSYNFKKEIRVKTTMLRSDLYDYSDSYIVLKGTITVTKRNKKECKKT